MHKTTVHRPSRVFILKPYKDEAWGLERGYGFITRHRAPRLYFASGETLTQSIFKDLAVQGAPHFKLRVLTQRCCCCYCCCCVSYKCDSAVEKSGSPPCCRPQSRITMEWHGPSTNLPAAASRHLDCVRVHVHAQDRDLGPLNVLDLLAILTRAGARAESALWRGLGRRSRWHRSRAGATLRLPSLSPPRRKPSVAWAHTM